MANSKATGKKQTHDIAPVVRAAFLNALEELKNRHGKTFSQIMADWMEKDPIAVINAVSKFTVREAKLEGKIEHEHKHVAISRVNDWLEQFTGSGEDSDTKTTSTH